MKYLEIPFTQEGEYNEMQKQWGIHWWNQINIQHV